MAQQGCVFNNKSIAIWESIMCSIRVRVAAQNRDEPRCLMLRRLPLQQSRPDETRQNFRLTTFLGRADALYFIAFGLR